jgi:hypothetical protein
LFARWNFEHCYNGWRIKEAEKVKNDPKLAQETEEQRKDRFSHDSIPRQLQLLFSRLQLRDVRAVKTKVHHHFVQFIDAM